MKVLLLALAVTIGVTSGQYDYRSALSKSILFYEAQRTGRLENNRISWRGDSFLGDYDGSIDLTGGYFDAGDHVKFGFPFASALTLLAMGVADFRSGYQNAGELANAQAGIKWGTDWILKATRLDQDAVYVQVGDGNTDHSYWGRPEEYPAGNYRPALKITSGQPGSDLAAQYAAALAAASMALDDASYKQTLISTAKNLYYFANDHRGIYSNSVSGAAGFYPSNGYVDELGFAAALIALATGEQQFKDQAVARWNEGDLGNDGEFFDWTNKQPAVAAVMARVFPGDQQYIDACRRYGDRWVYSQPRTPKGLIFINEWGSLRHAANVAFALMEYASLGINTNEYRNAAKQQIDYALGSAGRSYVVGFGNNPPTHCHHRGASCRDRPNSCDWNDLNKSDPNGQVLEGALVGGPDINDNYGDDRNNYQQNEVAIDYNAGFQGALAAIIQNQF